MIQDINDLLLKVDAIYSEMKSLECLKYSDKSFDLLLAEIAEHERHFLGKNGIITLLVGSIKNVSDKKLAGSVINKLKNEAKVFFSDLENSIKTRKEELILLKEHIDVTMPGRIFKTGYLHPVLSVMNRCLDIFSGMGFSIEYGKEIDTTYNLFDLLNFPEYHPAKESQDSFYLSNNKYMLRSQTSSAQVPIMKSNNDNVRVVVPGKCFRNEEVNSRSLNTFHQIEGLYVDKDVIIGDLLSCMEFFYSSLFNENVKLRFRPSFFPFVEPGIEVDLSCFICSGKGCFTCKRSGWLEVAGAGMVHPKVISNGGFDPIVYSGFAWGLGVERLTLLMFSINDIRLLVKNDLYFKH